MVYPRETCDICHFPISKPTMRRHMLICANRTPEQRQKAENSRAYAAASMTRHRLHKKAVRKYKNIARKRHMVNGSQLVVPTNQSIVTLSVKISFDDFCKILPLITKVAIV